MLQACLREGLVGGETFATDASVIEADASVMRRTEGGEPPGDWDDPGNVTRPVREYLDQLDKTAGLGGEAPQPPKALSLTDPSAALTNKGKSKIAFAYGDNYLIDTKAAIPGRCLTGQTDLAHKLLRHVQRYPHAPSIGGSSFVANAVPAAAVQRH